MSVGVATSPAITSVMFAALLPPLWNGLTVFAVCMTLTDSTCSPESSEASTLKPILAVSLSSVRAICGVLSVMRMFAFFQLMGIPALRDANEESVHG